MSALQREHKLNGEALDMIARGMRTSIVQILTDRPARLLRDYYREIHGVSPPSGYLPLANAVVGTRQRVKEGSLFLALYAAADDAVRKQIVPSALLTAYDVYVEWRPSLRLTGEPLTINEAYVIANAYRSLDVSLHPCQCGSQYIVASQTRLRPICPFCSTDGRSVGRRTIRR